MKRFFATMVVLTVFAIPTLAQEIQKPKYLAGEWCDYKDQFNNVFRRTVTVANEDGNYTLISEGELHARNVREYNREHQLVKRDDREFIPSWISPAFPIKVGQKGELGSFTYKRQSEETKAVSTLDSVVSENITVPAGNFATVVVRTSVKYTRPNGRTNKFALATWYASDYSMKWPLKHTFFDYGSEKNPSNVEISLVRCGVNTERTAGQ